MSILSIAVLTACTPTGTAPRSHPPPAAPSSTSVANSVNDDDAGGGNADAPAAFIPDTNVRDTPENRAALGFCQRYLTALDARDAKLLLELASPRYLDDAGTPKTNDDVSYDDLRESLRTLFDGVERVTSSVTYMDVRSEGDRIIVVLNLHSTFLADGFNHLRQGPSELVLERWKGSFRILSGM